MSYVRWNRFGNPDRWAHFGARHFDSDCNCADFTPDADVVEDEAGYNIYVELPGLSREDVSVNVEKGILTISGERKAPESGEDHFSRFERRYGRFERSFRLSDTIDVGAIAASMDKGVLTVSLPKREETKPRTIEVAIN